MAFHSCVSGNNPLDRLGRLRLFVAVADKASFAEAARTLGLSPTAASRAVASLEAELGVALLRRTTRSVALTPEGAAYLERARRALDELDEAARSLQGGQAEPKGVLIVTAPVVFGRLHILPIVTQLLAAHPGLDARLTLTDRLARLVEEGIDVAVRIAELADSALHATRVAEVRRALVASPAYLARRGTPRGAGRTRRPRPRRLRHVRRGGGVAVRRRHEAERARRAAPRDQQRRCGDRGGDRRRGVTRVLNYQTDAHVKARRLAYVMPEFDPPPTPVHLVTQANRLRSPNVRAFLDEARRRLRRLEPAGEA